jgi:hypothetical protein
MENVAKVSDGNGIATVGLQNIFVLDLGLVVLTGGKIALGLLEQARGFATARAAGASKREQAGSGEGGDDTIGCTGMAVHDSPCGRGDAVAWSRDHRLRLRG